MENRKYGFETLQLRAGQEIDPVSKATAVPIYQTTAYVFEDMQQGADLFALKKEGNIYTRITNTTNDVFENAVTTASGTAAIFLAVTNICGPGDNIVTSPFLYGGTFTMFEITLRDMGIQVRFAESDHVEDLEKLVDDRTKAIYLEILGNPAFNVPDFEPIVEMARRKGVCVMVDNTFGCGGYLFQPFSWGANVSIHSATKWICGHGTALGGVVVDGGNFDWTPEKYPLLAAPAESYHGLVSGIQGSVRKCRLCRQGACGRSQKHRRIRISFQFLPDAPGAGDIIPEGGEMLLERIGDSRIPGQASGSGKRQLYRSS